MIDADIIARNNIRDLLGKDTHRRAHEIFYVFFEQDIVYRLKRRVKIGALAGIDALIVCVLHCVHFLLFLKDQGRFHAYAHNSDSRFFLCQDHHNYDHDKHRDQDRKILFQICRRPRLFRSGCVL